MAINDKKLDEPERKKSRISGKRFFSNIKRAVYETCDEAIDKASVEAFHRDASKFGTEPHTNKTPRLSTLPEQQANHSCVPSMQISNDGNMNCDDAISIASAEAFQRTTLKPLVHAEKEHRLPMRSKQGYCSCGLASQKIDEEQSCADAVNTTSDRAHSRA
ncbi:hypothetical protein P280DRAFT_543260 [Massarina eburnea CBS 473.64]|uniref:Uncharacterized protein n=1 Tax=Massarina eburnea CBS 473.64 TaxID=1395130 RepID=A0A6A6S0G7_9PLEO|nr:hypothetical protein P280DRAFT_543260 [Massarina eburnea CBS 473.64]